MRERVTRRQFLWTVGVAAGGVAGCAPAVQVGGRAASVIVKLPWGKIWEVTKIVLDVASGVMTFIGIVDGVRKEYKTDLTSKQVSSLKEGADLILEGSDGKRVSGNETLVIHTQNNQDLDLKQWQREARA